ncbi:RDD family protein [Planococcus sp. APC 4015]|nr:RDD family protein [Planococcus sp. APC 4015]
MPEVTAPASPARMIDVHQDEILTGEAVALDVQPIGFFLRALGTFIDMLLGGLLFLLFTLVAGLMFGLDVFGDSVVRIVTVTMLVLIMVVIPTAVETFTRGRSLGKLVVGGRIVRADGGAAGFRQAFIRALVGVFELWFTFGSVAAVVGAFTPRSQRLGDLLAGTYSERTRTPALPPSAPGLPPALEEWATVADVARLPERLSRRIAHFARQAPLLEPAARARLAASLAAETAPHVSPMPTVDPETFVCGVAAIRRERELRGLVLEGERVERLAAGVRDVPRGFPER